MKIYFDNRTGDYQHRFKYVVDFILLHPLCEDKIIRTPRKQTAEVIIQYGGNSDEATNTFYIPKQALFFQKEKYVSISSLEANQFLQEGVKVYSVEEENKRQDNTFFEKNQFAFDLIETIFFHLSRYEEYYCDKNDLDEWDSMKEENQFLVKHNLEKIPVLDVLVKCFLKAIGFSPSEIKSKKRITHDIDHLVKFKSILTFLKFNFFYLKSRHGISSIQQLWSSYYKCVFGNEKPYEVLDSILTRMDFEKEIYFLVGGKAEVDTPLNVKSKAFIEAIRISKERGYKIGIHPSYATWKNEALLKQEKSLLENIIEQEICISRQHYLHFSFSETIDILESAGIVQDSTIGFNRRVGFRAGTGTSFYLYNLKKDGVSKVKEEPLSFMDSSLFIEADFNGERFQTITKDFLEANEFGTGITFNFHNSRFDDAKMFNLPQERLYKEIVNGK